MRTTKWNHPLLALLIGFQILLFGCPRSSPVPPKSTLVVALEASPTQLDPRYATDAYSERISQLLYNGLVDLDPRGEIVPSLAEQWKVEEDRIYTFLLRSGVRFHDGSLLQASDVRYTYESILAAGQPSPHQSLYAVIERIETPDNRTVRFVLKQPHAPFLLSLTRGIVPRHLAESSAESFASDPVGTGPFAFVRWVHDAFVELKSNPDYFEGAPKMSKILFRIIPEEGTRLLELLAGNIDLVVNALSPDLLDQVDQDPRLRILRGEGSSYSYLGFNLADPILKDLRVRRAIAHAIDRPGIVKNILRDTATLASGLLPPYHWASQSDLPQYHYAPEESRRLLKATGIPLPIRLSFKTSQDAVARRVAEAMQHQLAQVGIDLDLRTYEWGTFYADIKSGRFQLYTLRWIGITDPDIYHRIFHSDSLPPNGANRGRYINREVDRLLLEGRTALDRSKRRRIYHRVQQILAEELPYVSLWYNHNVVIIKRNIEGFVLYPAGDLTSLKAAARIRR